MDKKPIEIMQDVAKQKGYTGILIDEYGEIALEAMKIFGKQCFNAGGLNYGVYSQEIDWKYKDYDEYIKGLEEKK